jgi:hypothetical protein
MKRLTFIGSLSAIALAGSFRLVSDHSPKNRTHAAVLGIHNDVPMLTRALLEKLAASLR